ncbi:MAG: ferrous iron transporter B [Candidatus Altiarchaeota archaeon]|nr:ferrous iron transporter B [Candidatus Altiarchaeota archaeon]
MKILLVGNPNVGKSVVFSRLTGVDVIASNYPGTTVEFTRGTTRVGGETAELIDTPGTYSLEPKSSAEEVTSRMLEEADFVINVVDATNLERNLYLTLELLERDIPMIVALNMWDDTKHLGIDIDLGELEESLGVPVVPTVAVTGEGFKELVYRIPDARSPKIHEHTHDERWSDVGKIIEGVQVVTHRHHTIWERLADATIKPATGIPLALFILYITFQIVRFMGEGLIGYVFEPVFELYKPFVMELGLWLGPGILYDLLIGRLIDGGIDYMQSMGLLTTGLFVPFAAVLPYIIAFYFMLSLLEDTGYLPRLATLMDNVFHRLGMHGHGIVPLFLGIGCNVPGALATRIMETRKQRFIAATLMAIAVPCMAQIAMIFGILGRYGMEYIYLVFITLAMVYLVGGILLNRFIKGECPEIFLEVPPYRRPNIETLLKKTWLRVRWFLMEAIPWLFFGILLVNILYMVGLFEFMGDLFTPLMETWLGLPGEAVAVLLIGFLRKDLAVGMLFPLGMSPLQLVIATVMLTIYFPCAATFATLLRELGIRDMLKSTLIMLGTALTVGGILRIILLGL